MKTVTLFCVDTFDALGYKWRAWYRDLENAKSMVRETVNKVPANRRGSIIIRQEEGPSEEDIKTGRCYTSAPIWTMDFHGLEGLKDIKPIIGGIK